VVVAEGLEIIFIKVRRSYGKLAHIHYRYICNLTQL
jgi:hypothetical protein